MLAKVYHFEAPPDHIEAKLLYGRLDSQHSRTGINIYGVLYISPHKQLIKALYSKNSRSILLKFFVSVNVDNVCSLTRTLSLTYNRCSLQQRLA